MKRRLMSLLLACVMLFTLLPVQAFAAGTDSPFRDVPRSSWYYDSVQYVCANELFKGTSADTFSPSDFMTRGMFVTVLGRMAGVDAEKYAGPSDFTDVPENAYFAPYVRWATQYGITTGTGEGKFSPQATINRQQMAVFFVRYFEAFGVDYATGVNVTGTPADMDSVSAYAKDAVLKLWRQGLLNGNGRTFDPFGNATRAQAATICYRTDDAVDTWYSEPGVPSTRVRINPATGRPYGESGKPDASKPSSGSSGSGGGGGGNAGGGTEPVPSDSWSVKFYDGSRLIKSFSVKKGEPLGQVPAVAESSKAGYILEGYYTDAGFTTPFYAEEPVTGNMSVYAKYAEMGGGEELTVDSFARMDQDETVSFRFKALEGAAGSAEGAVKLSVKDGSDPVAISVRANGDGTYTVFAPAGFNPGCSYELNLAEGWTFLPDGSGTIPSEAIRTAAFSIEMAEAQDLSMSRGIRYVRDTEAIQYTYTDEKGASHSVAELPSNADITGGGSFNYDGSTAGWGEGDILCIYVGARPDDKNDNTKTEEAIYAKVSGISGGTVSFVPLDEQDQSRLYEIPDNFPFQVAALPRENADPVYIRDLDTAVYAVMVGTDEATVEKAKARINVGDFISLYTDPDTIESEDDVFFGEITGYNAATGEIFYRETTARAIEDSANLYKSVDVENTDYVTPAEAEEIAGIVQAQVERSDFAREAAYVLADLATQTDGFRRSMGVTDFTATGEDGTILSDAQLVSYAGVMELDGEDDGGVEVKVAVVLDKNKLHFGNKGVQLAVQVDAKFKVDAKDGAVHFDLSATFVQEVAVDPKIKGELVYKKVLKCIPFPTGVQVNAIVDVKSYTAMSLRADIYTVAEEEKPLWEQFKAFTKDPSALADIPGLPAGLTDGLKNVGDAIDKIEETKAKIDKGLEDTGKLQSDLEALWSVVEASARDGLTKETYEAACEKLGKTNIAGELMELLHLSEEGISADYISGLDELIDRYSELLEKETDWVQLVDAEMFSASTPPEFGVMVGVRGSFVVRADINITLGTNLEYEVGKRYNFWFRVGLFKPTSGTSTMDLIDEHFAFQFYVMGKLGLKTGVRLKLYAAIGSVDAVSVGLTTELGPYVKLWGFFIYDYSKYRPANTQKWTYKEQMAGALYLEFGLYLMAGVEAKALFMEVDHDFVDEEFPLLDAGKRYYYYSMDYEPNQGVGIRVNNNAPAEGYVAAMPLSDYYRAVRRVDLTTGAQSIEALDYDQYLFQLSNPHFELVIAPDNKSASLRVKTVPEGVRYMECDLTITYKYGKMAFSTFDMSTTVHLVWTNMDSSELTEFYTVSVRVPDADGGGYSTVWSQQVRKSTPFDLPTGAEIEKLLSWNDAKYVRTTGYGGQQTEGLTVIRDTVYDYQIGYQTYQLTVTGIEGGSASSQTFTGRYGEPFDFSSLRSTGKNGPTEFTRFAGLLLDGETLPLNQPITGRFAASLDAAAAAQYEDETVTATFTFDGLTQEPVEVKLRRGGTPDITPVRAAVPDHLTITDIYPAVGPIEGNMSYQVACTAPAGSMASITFDAKGGSAVDPMSLPVGSMLGTLPVPTRTGYAFGGWFTDDGTFTSQADPNGEVPEGGLTLYAKWTASDATVSFHVNGGDSWTEDTGRGVVFGSPYGPLPVPTRTDWRFDGWFTQLTGGDLVTAETEVSTVGDHTLYAHWTEMREIPRTIFQFDSTKPLHIGYFSGGWKITSSGWQLAADDIKDRIPYETANEYGGPVYQPEDGAGYTFGDFTITYKQHRDALCYGWDFKDKIDGAGTYTVKIVREAEGLYKRFEATYDGVIVVDRVPADVAANDVEESKTVGDNSNDMSKVTGIGNNGTYGRVIEDNTTTSMNGWQFTRNGTGTAYYMQLAYRTRTKSVEYTFTVVNHGTNTVVGNPVTLKNNEGLIQQYVVFENLPVYDQNKKYDIRVAVKNHANYEDHTITIAENTDLY